MNQTKPKLGDLGYIPMGNIGIPVAVVKHMIKDDTLCFMRRFAGTSDYLSWDEIGCIEMDEKRVWKYIENTLEIKKCMQWIFSKPLVNFP